MDHQTWMGGLPLAGRKGWNVLSKIEVLNTAEARTLSTRPSLLPEIVASARIYRFYCFSLTFVAFYLRVQSSVRFYVLPETISPNRSLRHSLYCRQLCTCTCNKPRNFVGRPDMRTEHVLYNLVLSRVGNHIMY